MSPLPPLPLFLWRPDRRRDHGRARHQPRRGVEGQTSPLNVRRIGGVTMAENHASWSHR
jgi:hypothetical protein